MIPKWSQTHDLGTHIVKNVVKWREFRRKVIQNYQNYLKMMTENKQNCLKREPTRAKGPPKRTHPEKSWFLTPAPPPCIYFQGPFVSKILKQSGKIRKKHVSKSKQKSMTEKSGKTHQKHAKIRSQIFRNFMKFREGWFYEKRVFAWTVCLKWRFGVPPKAFTIEEKHCKNESETTSWKNMENQDKIIQTDT